MQSSWLIVFSPMLEGTGNTMTYLDVLRFGSSNFHRADDFATAIASPNLEIFKMPVNDVGFPQMRMLVFFFLPGFVLTSDDKSVENNPVWLVLLCVWCEN